MWGKGGRKEGRKRGLSEERQTERERKNISEEELIDCRANNNTTMLCLLKLLKLYVKKSIGGITRV